MVTNNNSSTKQCSSSAAMFSRMVVKQHTDTVTQYYSVKRSSGNFTKASNTAQPVRFEETFVLKINFSLRSLRVLAMVRTMIRSTWVIRPSIFWCSPTCVSPRWHSWAFRQGVVEVCYVCNIVKVKLLSFLDNISKQCVDSLLIESSIPKTLIPNVYL